MISESKSNAIDWIGTVWNLLYIDEGERRGYGLVGEACEHGECPGGMGVKTDAWREPEGAVEATSHWGWLIFGEQGTYGGVHPH